MHKLTCLLACRPASAWTYMHSLHSYVHPCVSGWLKPLSESMCAMITNLLSLDGSHLWAAWPHHCEYWWTAGACEWDHLAVWSLCDLILHFHSVEMVKRAKNHWHLVGEDNDELSYYEYSHFLLTCDVWRDLNWCCITFYVFSYKYWKCNANDKLHLSIVFTTQWNRSSSFRKHPFPLKFPYSYSLFSMKSMAFIFAIIYSYTRLIAIYKIMYRAPLASSSTLVQAVNLHPERE